MELKSNLVDIYKHPSNRGIIENASLTVTGSNESCGDSVKIYLKIENDIVTDAKFEGEGCVLSMAGTDLLLKYLKNKKFDEVKNITTEKMLGLLRLENISPGRLKCVLLPVMTLSKTVEQTTKTA